MTALILLTQIAMPLALLAWLGFWPARSAAGVLLQAAGTGAFLFALARVAQRPWGRRWRCAGRKGFPDQPAGNSRDQDEGDKTQEPHR